MENFLIEVTKIFTSSPDPIAVIVGTVILTVILFLKIKRFNLDASVTQSNITEKEFKVLHDQINFLSNQLKESNEKLENAQREFFKTKEELAKANIEINILREKIRILEEYHETNSNREESKS